MEQGYIILQCTASDTSLGTAFGTVSDTNSGIGILYIEKLCNNQNISHLFPNENHLESTISAPHRHKNGTPSDTPSGTKKNKDINIFINDNNAHAHESIQQEINEMNANQSWQEAICMRHPFHPTIHQTSIIMHPISVNQVLRISSATPSSGLSVSHSVLSERQRADMATFKKLFPSEEHVLAFFAPAGVQALYSYLRREYVSQGRDPRESSLYQLGKITDEQLQIVLSEEESAF